MTLTEFRLETLFETQESDAFGRLAFAMTNLSGEALSGFTLCYSALTRSGRNAEVTNGRLLRRVANYHEFAPPEGFVLAAGESWTFALEGLSHRPRHRLDGPKAAYLVLQDGTTRVVTTGDLKNPAAPSGPLRDLPEGKLDLPLSVLPWPQDCSIQTWRTDAPVLVPVAGSDGDDLAASARIAALCQRLFPQARVPFSLAGPGLPLRFRHDAALAAETYRLDFAADCVSLSADSPSGRDYGLTTLAQIGMAAQEDSGRFRFPETGSISDAPRYGWRGTHLDVSRHFRPLDEVLRFLDIMAWLKMNRFQWHLTDDEGWRLEIAAYPELTQTGAWRGHGLPLVPQLGSGAEAYGGFYSQDQVRQAVAHAAALNIEIIPEIDIPGHSTAVLKALPHLADPDEAANSYRSIQGYPNNALNPGMEQTYSFLQTVLGEVAQLFPGQYIHVGADEVDGASWLQSPRARVLMQYEGLANTSELQAHLLRKVQGMVRGLGKRLAGWDEVSHGGGVEPEGTLLVAWQKPEVIGKLAEQGYDVIASPGQAYYLDMVQADGWDEPGTSWAGTSTPQHCYEYEAAGDLSAALAHRLKGVQACIWCEHLRDKALFNYMVFPRLAAVAEAGWTEKGRKDWQRFARLSKGLPQL